MQTNDLQNLSKMLLAFQTDETTKKRLLNQLLTLKEREVNILICGATGSGKSSTINAILQKDVAPVGVGVNPETTCLEKYQLDNLIFWDSPGLGDGKDMDEHYAKMIIDKLLEADKEGNALIDLVIIVIDGSSKDLGTTYQLINKIIVPHMGDGVFDNVVIAINQADMAMSGQNWDFVNNKPSPKLLSFLEEKAESISQRIFEATDYYYSPIYYSAGFKENNVKQTPPYNISELLFKIIQAIPDSRRNIYSDAEQFDRIYMKSGQLIQQIEDFTTKYGSHFKG